MTVQERFAHATRRVASLSSVARNRLSEAERVELRGEDGQLGERLETLVEKFESIADEMEKALA